MWTGFARAGAEPGPCTDRGRVAPSTGPLAEEVERRRVSMRLGSCAQTKNNLTLTERLFDNCRYGVPMKRMPQGELRRRCPVTHSDRAICSRGDFSSRPWHRVNDLNRPLMDLLCLIVNEPDRIASDYERIWHQQLGRERAFYDEVRAQFNAQTALTYCFICSRAASRRQYGTTRMAHSIRARTIGAKEDAPIA